MKPAERLLAAADLLEKRAGEATEGPWSAPTGPRYVFLDGFSGHDVDGPKNGFVARGTYWADATYIATMHPEVGKLLAASLREAAHTIEGNARLMAQGRPMINIASAFLLDLADLLLAGGS